MDFKIGDKVRIINVEKLFDDERIYPHRKIGTEFIISNIINNPHYNYNVLDEQGRGYRPYNLQKILMATDTRTSKRFEVHSYTDETVLEALSHNGTMLRGRPRAHVAIDGIDSPYVPVLALTNTIKDAAEFLNDIARASKMSKANCEVADQHAQALYQIITASPAVTGKLSSLDLKNGDVVATGDEQYIARLESPYWSDGLHLVKLSGSGWTMIHDSRTFRVVSRAPTPAPADDGKPLTIEQAARFLYDSLSTASDMLEPAQKVLEKGLFFTGLRMLYESAPADDGWIEWNGGKCPVDHDAQVEVKLRKDPALITPYRAGNLSWAHRDNRLRPYDIIAYRVVK